MKIKDEFKKTRKSLNNIYQELHEDKNIIAQYLDMNEYLYIVGFYAYHSFKEDNEFYIEQYPIPVFTINNILDIGIDIDKIFFEFKLTKDKALEYDFHIFDEYTFEVYGVDDYYDDYYYDNIDEIHDNILKSNELEIGVSILIDKENIIEDTTKILELLTNSL